MYVGQQFESYEDVEEAIASLSEETFAVFSKQISRTAEAANKEIKEGCSLCPPRLKYSMVKFVCKHYGDPRTCSKGIRPVQR